MWGSHASNQYNGPPRLLHSPNLRLEDYQWDMGHGIQMTGVTTGIYLNWGITNLQCILNKLQRMVGSYDHWEFPLFFRDNCCTGSCITSVI